MARNEKWSTSEVNAIVRDYFAMLGDELQGRPYVKAQHRKALRPLLDGRSEGAIEMKHCNISAVLDEMGLQYIHGYKPRRNVQQLLRDVVARHVQANSSVAKRTRAMKSRKAARA